MTDGELSIGDVVVDRDDKDPNEAIVVNRPPMACEDWDLADGGTVADDPTNEDYPDDSRVAIVVYSDILEDNRPDFEGDSPLSVKSLCDDLVQWYAFPEPRLARVRHMTEDPDPEPSDALLAIADELAGRDMRADVDANDGVVRTEYLGETYEIGETGEVTGGSMSGRIESVVGEVQGND